MSTLANNRVKSSWTPLTNGETNNKLFEERKKLTEKWFEKWSEKQRANVLSSLLQLCTQKQLRYVDQFVNSRLPTNQDDFTRILPRVITLYIFSFLDPRSLCRCAQVCWYWKQLSELDQLWLPKCVRFGWYLPHLPTPFETCVWKRHYVDQIQSLRLFRTKASSPDLELEKLKLDSKREQRQNTSKLSSKKTKKPWRGSDPHPKDMIRYNYLDNTDDYTKRCKEDFYKTTEKPNLSAISKQILNATYTIKYNQRSKSLSKLNSTDRTSVFSGHDSSNTNHLLNATTTMNPMLVQTAENFTDSVKRPPPVVQHKKTPRVQSARTPRDPPSNALFPSQPWAIPVGGDENTDSDS